MSILFKNAGQLITSIDDFIDNVERGVLTFKEGVKNYLLGDNELFYEKLKTLERLEAEADKLQREIDDGFYRYSILPQNADDIEKMMDMLDEIIDVSKEILYQFDVEIPFIPPALTQDYIKLAEASAASALMAFPAVRDFFREPLKVKDRLVKVYFYEKEADKISRNIKRHIFHNMDELKLSQKLHLRYFALHIETISDKAEILADALSIMAIKISM